MTSLQTFIDKAAILVEALPYIQEFRDKTVVVKYGGSIGTGAPGEDTILKDIVFMEHVGINPVIVHGGGPAIDRRLKELKIETRRVNGLRITDAGTMKVVEETLFDVVNAAIVEQLERLGGRAAGVSARLAGIMHVRRHTARDGNGAPVDIGLRRRGRAHRSCPCRGIDRRWHDSGGGPDRKGGEGGIVQRQRRYRSRGRSPPPCRRRSWCFSPTSRGSCETPPTIRP